MKLSIIIPCYNNEWCVGDTIESIKMITQEELECIIINDGSTDESERVISEHIGDDERFRLITTENKGVAMARNLGLSLANSDICMFIDSDDIMNPIYPKNAVEYMEKHPECPLYFGGVKTFGMRECVLLPKWKGYEHMLKTPCVFVSAAFRREHALKIGGFNAELDAFEDYEFWVRYLYHNSDNVKRTAQIMYDYRITSNSRHFSHSNKELYDIFNSIKEIDKHIYDEYNIQIN